MKIIRFKPLRRLKGSGKIAVASYPQWYGLATANYNPFQLVVIDEYGLMNQDEQVHNHKGEELFFPNYDPNEMPMFSDASHYPLSKHYEENLAFLYYNDGGTYGSPSVSYHGRGIDCMGTPTFAHFTMDSIATHYKDMNMFEPLTVGIVTNWLGWFLYRLENAKLTIERKSLASGHGPDRG